MAKLFYGASASPIEIPDRLLAHVKVVVATKLRRGEAFTLSWTGPSGRESIWIQQSIPLRFVFSSPEPETLDPELLSRLARSANVAGNLALDFAAEPEPQKAPAAGAPLRAVRRPVAA
jgi:hypothetical protein